MHSVLQPVDDRDIRMIQGGEDFGFALKARHPLRIRCKQWRQDLDRNLAF
jgi:hypothetical protein